MLFRMRALEEQMQRIVLENSFLKSRVQELEDNRFPLKEAIREIYTPISPKFSEDSPVHGGTSKRHQKSYSPSSYLH
jgi:hypothetical protein